MTYAGKCCAALCLLGAVCAAAAYGEDGMMPGIQANVVPSSGSDRRRRPIRVRTSIPKETMPANFGFLGRSWQHEDAHHLNSVAPTASGDASGALTYARNDDVSLNEVAPVVFPGNKVGPGARRGDEESTSTMTKNLDEMSMNDQLMVSYAGTVEEFARLMGISLPPGGGGFVAASTSGDSGIAARFGGLGDDGLPTATPANCLPENKTVMIKIEPQLNVMFFPTCVRLPRCGGCCTGPLLKCRPTEMRTVQLKILKMEEKEVDEPQVRSAIPIPGVATLPDDRRRRPKPEGSRRRRETASSYMIVEEEEHLACSCQCRVQAKDCNNVTHNYLVNECRCACKNQDEHMKCEQRGDTHYWSKEDCMCYCYSEEACSTGQLYDHNTCSCVNADARVRSGLSVRRGTGGPASVAFPAA